jgi:cysteine synthase A
MLFQNVNQLIGKTPIVKLNKIGGTGGAEVFAKLEYFNPGGSVKDRIALNMIKKAEDQGLISKDTIIVEPTSGNTGIGLAMVAAAKGYRLVLVMPETMSIERRKLLSAYGAEIILTPGPEGMKGAVEKAEALVAENKHYILPQQFKNPGNPEIHYLTTGPEIYEDFKGELDYFVAGIGTGGTITGTGRYLKEKLPNIKIIGVEPEASPVLSGGQAGPHKLQGIGAGFIPDVLEIKILDKIIGVKNEDAFETARRLAKEEGILAGISAGAAVFAALSLAKGLDANQKILTIIPDTGERYLSTDLF